MPRSTASPTHTYSVPIGFGPRGYLREAEGVVACALACAEVILATPVGESPNEPLFGSRLPELVWEPNDAALAAEIRAEAAEAIARWEPRLTVERTTVRQEGHITAVDVTFLVRGTNVRLNRTVRYARG